ncbi:Coenzyme F420 hydrogenase/dehydrogenase, beta subunit C-terminal domain [Victivallis vadensis]|uniref:Coenzyme F420 hydrogenase/dehydrogenase, beta subunit C-terminal domain n=1 Tax=Victivallis vadensis TaxID=172901 RepID=UPI003D018697
MIALCSRLECTGCGACANRCPHGSITMLEDTEGFSQPMINAENCTKCGACLRVCPVLNPVSLHSPTEEVYAAWALDDSLRRTSSSGGMYSVLAEEILKHGGAVVGSTFDSDFILRVRLADNQTDVAKLRGSKYVQNEPGKIYQEIEEVLKQKRPVLYCSTPCQVAALRVFLAKEYPELYTCDLVCHGVPSPRMFREYLKHILHKNQFKKICDFQFRELEGWGYSHTSIKTREGQVVPTPYQKDYYLWAFSRGITNRESCYRCRYACQSRCGDLTLGDFWGLGEDKEFPYPTDRGVSLVLINSSQGEKLFRAVSGKIFKAKRDLAESLVKNTQLRKPVTRMAVRDTIYQDFYRMEPAAFCRKYRLVTPPGIKLITLPYRATRRLMHIFSKYYRKRIRK